MKICCISDTHTCHRDLIMPEADILIHAGDVSFQGEKEVYEDFDEWLGSLNYDHKIIVAGNHDFRFYDYPWKNAIALNDQATVIDGLKVWGSPITPRYGDWAFMKERGNDIAKHWKLIPGGVDILITHGPPMGILDETVPPRYEHVGCYDLKLAVERLIPRLHIFGHIHNGYGMVPKDGTLFVNASICDEMYEPVNKPIVVEVYNDLARSGIIQ